MTRTISKILSPFKYATVRILCIATALLATVYLVGVAHAQASEPILDAQHSPFFTLPNQLPTRRPDAAAVAATVSDHLLPQKHVVVLSMVTRFNTRGDDHTTVLTTPNICDDSDRDNNSKNGIFNEGKPGSLKAKKSSVFEARMLPAQLESTTWIMNSIMTMRNISFASAKRVYLKLVVHELLGRIVEKGTAILGVRELVMATVAEDDSDSAIEKEGNTVMIHNRRHRSKWMWQSIQVAKGKDDEEKNSTTTHTPPYRSIWSWCILAELFILGTFLFIL